MIHKPYTYLIRFKITGQLYYGCRTAIGCSPDDLWVKYFTSSKIVKKLIAEHGADSFEVVSIKLHSCKEDALKWEELYLVSVDAGYNEEYLNRHNGGKNFTTSGINTPIETKIKQSNTHKNRLKNNEYRNKLIESALKLHSDVDCIKKQKIIRLGESYKLHQSVAMKKVWDNEEKRKLKSIQMKKKYIVTFPDGHEEVVIGLVEFCKKYNLSASAMSQVSKGKHFHHHHFKCRYQT